MTTEKETIGILAGMGPRSTAPFIDLVLAECQQRYGAGHDLEFPHMMIYSLPVPFDDQPVDHQRLSRIIAGGLKRLADAGVAFIAMPCNTAHRYYDELAASIDVPLLNMIDEAIDHLPAGAKRIAVLGTRLTFEAGLYQQRLQRSGLAGVVKEGEQDRIDRLIAGIHGWADRTQSQAQWDELLGDMRDAGADTVIVACTDLNVLDLRGRDDGLRIVDGTRCLAQAVVRSYLNLIDRAP